MKTFLRRATYNRGSSSLAITCTTALLLFLGCSDNSPDHAVSGGRVVIKGSNTIGEELAPRLIAEYRKDKPRVMIDLESKGTASGFSALVANQCDIAAASRVVSPAELAAAASNHVDLSCYMLGSYAVAVIVNSSNQVANLTRDQVRDIFTGAIQNWKQAGGNDAPIHLFARSRISGTYLGFRELAMEDKPYAESVKTYTNYNAIIESVGRDIDAIGYCGINVPRRAGVKALTIRGVAPDVLAVNESRYPLARVLRLYTDKSKESAVAQDFIQFVQSPRGQAIVAEMGYVPRP